MGDSIDPIIEPIIERKHIQPVFKVSLVGSQNKETIFNIKQTILFQGRTIEDTNVSSYFSDIENTNNKLNSTKISTTTQYIHRDDTLHGIKNKIIKELGVNDVCYDELYLFAKVEDKLNLYYIYSNLTRNDTVDFTHSMLETLARNLRINLKLYHIPIQSTYTFELLYRHLYKEFEKKQSYYIPLGQRFPKFNNLLFSSNPYDNISDTENPFKLTSDNPLQTFDNTLLLTYGIILDNSIYVALIKDVYEYTQISKYDYTYITSLYYPLLGTKGIDTYTKYNERHMELIENNKENIDSNFENYNNKIDTLREIYYTSQNERLSYDKRGIKNFHFIIHPTSQVKLPLDIIFKKIHCTKSMPFIKYNPGFRKENMYRLYSLLTSKSGQKVPDVNSSKIKTYSKTMGKKNQQLSCLLLIDYKDNDGDEHVVEVVIDINANGDIHIVCNNIEFIDKDKLDIFLNENINSVLKDINGFLQTTGGYKLNLFNTFNDTNIEILSLVYMTQLILNKKMKFDSNKQCISSFFDVITENRNGKENVIELRYKRVENYKPMDAVSALLHDIYSKGEDDDNVMMKLLMDKFTMTKETALDKIKNYFNTYTLVNGEWANKGVNVVEHPGFISYIRIVENNNTALLSINNINNILYINEIEQYIDSFFRISQMPESIKVSTKDICSSKEIIDKQVDMVVGPKNIVAVIPEDEDESDLDEDDEEEDESDSDNNFIFFSDEEDDEEDEDGFEKELEEVVEGENDLKGGVKSNIDRKDYTKTQKKRQDNFAYERLKQYAPKLIILSDTKDDSDGTNKIKYKAYSRSCAASMGKQPIILSDKEKKTLDDMADNKGKSYTYALKYGPDNKDKYWYICPRYWCKSEQRPLTEKEVKDKVCDSPNDIVEFSNKANHFDENGNYQHFVPGFFDKSEHPKGYGIPCCFRKKWESTQLVNRRIEQKVNEDTDVTKGTVKHKTEEEKTEEEKTEEEKTEEEKTEEEKTKNKTKVQSNKSNYIVDSNKKVGFEKFGYLPINVLSLFGMNPSHSNSITVGEKTLLRNGVQTSEAQSFISSIANIYGYKKNMRKPPTIEEMRNLIADSITFDDFLQYFNGNLTSVFIPVQISVNDTEEYKSSNYYINNIKDKSNVVSLKMFQNRIASYKHFLQYLRDVDSWIDHTYLWDVISTKNKVLFPDGINLLIIAIPENDITDNIELICPTNTYKSPLYDDKLNTIILLKTQSRYEPVFSYQKVIDNKKTSTVNNPFFKKDDFIGTPIEEMKDTINKHCKPFPSMRNVYTFKQNYNVNKIVDILITHTYYIQKQVTNYSDRLIGLIVSETKEHTNGVFVPCSPSGIIKDKSIIRMDEVVWTSYARTTKFLTQLSKNTRKQILSNPVFKVIEDELIVGIFTETNQMVQVDPPIQNDVIDDIPEYNVSGYKDNGYYEADKTIMTSDKIDDARIDTIKNIKLETKFYISFRNTLRIVLKDPTHGDKRQSLVDALDNPNYLYQVKLKKIVLILRNILKHYVSFDKIGEELLNSITEMTECISGCSNEKQYCLLKDNDCTLIIPNKNLITNADNEIFYYLKIADELIRHSRVRMFLLEPNKFLNIGKIDYEIDKNEILLLQSTLDGGYLDNLKGRKDTEKIPTITYDFAHPIISDNYSNAIEYNPSEIIIDKEDNIQFNNNCIKKTGLVIGNVGQGSSYWKNVFHINSKEIQYNIDNKCNFYIILHILHDMKRINTNILDNDFIKDIKEKLVKGYNELLPEYKKQIYNILKLQHGKKEMVKQLEKNQIEFETLIQSEEYFLTELDLWILAIELELPIVLFSKKDLKQLNLNITWLFLGRGDLKGHYYFIRCPSLKKDPLNTNKVLHPDFHLILPAQRVNDMVNHAEEPVKTDDKVLTEEAKQKKEAKQKEEAKNFEERVNHTTNVQGTIDIKDHFNKLG